MSAFLPRSRHEAKEEEDSPSFFSPSMLHSLQIELKRFGSDLVPPVCVSVLVPSASLANQIANEPHCYCCVMPVYVTSVRL